MKSGTRRRGIVVHHDFGETESLRKKALKEQAVYGIRLGNA
jgi:hypothetical protein